MDPIVLLILGVVLVIVVLRVFFGLTKFILKIGLIIIAALVIWRVFFVQA